MNSEYIASVKNRFLAFLVDICCVFFPVYYACTFLLYGEFPLEIRSKIAILASMLFPIGILIRFSATPGQMLLGLRVRNSEQQAIKKPAQLLLYFFSDWFLGYLSVTMAVAFFDDKRRTLANHLSKTLVVSKTPATKKSRPIVGTIAILVCLPGLATAPSMLVDFFSMKPASVYKNAIQDGTLEQLTSVKVSRSIYFSPLTRHLFVDIDDQEAIDKILAKYGDHKGDTNYGNDHIAESHRSHMNYLSKYSKFYERLYSPTEYEQAMQKNIQAMLDKVDPSLKRIIKGEESFEAFKQLQKQQRDYLVKYTSKEYSQVIDDFLNGKVPPEVLSQVKTNNHKFIDEKLLCDLCFVKIKRLKVRHYYRVDDDFANYTYVKVSIDRFKKEIALEETQSKSSSVVSQKGDIVFPQAIVYKKFQPNIALKDVKEQSRLESALGLYNARLHHYKYAMMVISDTQYRFNGKAKRQRIYKRTIAELEKIKSMSIKQMVAYDPKKFDNLMNVEKLEMGLDKMELAGIQYLRGYNIVQTTKLVSFNEALKIKDHPILMDFKAGELDSKFKAYLLPGKKFADEKKRVLNIVINYESKLNTVLKQYQRGRISILALEGFVNKYYHELENVRKDLEFAINYQQ